MPLYEYICAKCNGHSELLVRSAKEKAVCPSCGSTRMDRQFSTFAAHSAGSGQSPCGSGTCPSTGMACPGGACPLG
jgi:putative FmdB family regulatory protein